MGLLDNKVTLITGAGAGIGRASAVLFSQEGAKLVLFSRTKEAVEKTADMVRGNGGDVVVIVGNVANAEDTKLAVSTALDTYGQLDCAFNNAGVEGQFGPLATLDESVYEETLSINLKGVWLSMKYQIPALLEAGGGAIVNMSSNISITGMPGTSLYTASKAGVDGLTRCGAMDYARHNIRINAVAPGSVENTAMTSRLWTEEQQQASRTSNPTGRLSTPEDVAEAAIWLCSDRSKHINGQVLNIDGGFITR
ncbi:3-oxoacyl-[acyl-carrier protein] reductase [hydrothermal vent metagenome]|uniref:3-oxoacyl-[acyl-carrier protein] reductase n=1 Tax=hydrothermal vent metagenome TaxID=652676 RepID=A0A3B0XAI9_9ZZZZ